jgi:hypothetical protein
VRWATEGELNGYVSRPKGIKVGRSYVRVHVDHVYAPRLKPVFQLVLAGYTAVKHNVVEYNTLWLNTIHRG